jgi:putative membrane protein
MKRLTLATGALLLMAGAAFAQSTTVPGATTSTGATTPGTSMAPPMRTNPTVQTPGASVNTTAQTTNSPSPSAVQTHDTASRTAAAPVPGRNSFTMGQARSRITAAGYSDVKGLKKDDQGIWRGQASKDGAMTNVSLDYQGNVVSK